MLFSLIFHPLKVVPRYRDPRFQVGDNYSYLSDLSASIYNSYWINIKMFHKKGIWLKNIENNCSRD